MKNKFLKLTLVCVAFATILSCNDNDYTDDSALIATSPSLTVSLGFANSQTLVEQETSFDVTVTISETQIVDVLVYLEQTAGTATEGTDFTIPHSITIPKGALSASDVISIHADELIEDTETATIQIGLGTEPNVESVSGQTVIFNIANLTADDLGVSLSWDTIGYQYPDGTSFDPTTLADLRLLVTDSPYTTITGEADGASFEAFIITAATPDGEYLIVSDFYAAYDLGSQGFFDVDLTVTFDQVGTINGESYTFPAALNSAAVCTNNYYVLAKVIKSGGNYTIEQVGTNNFAEQQVSWSVGTDVTDTIAGSYTSAIATQVDCIGTKIAGLNSEWMQTTWGEEIIDEGNVYYTIDIAGVITIPSQYIFTTLYNGVEYPYTVSGNGTWDTSGATPVLTINYYLDQDGFSPNQWMFDNGYTTQNYFIATVSP